MLKKILLILLAAALVLPAGCQSAQPGGEEPDPPAKEKYEWSVPFYEDNFVLKHGRCYIDEENTFCEIANTASGLELEFQGTSLYLDCTGSFSSEGEAYLCVYEDDVLYGTVAVDLVREERLIYENQDGGRHRIKILKRSEAQYSTVTVYEVFGDGSFYPVQAEEGLKIAFYGDSITCGLGSLPQEQTATEQEDGLQTYAMLAVRKLGARADICAASGWAIDKADWHTSDMRIPRVFRQYSLYREEVFLTEDRETDVVVVNLGTNDYTYYQNHMDEISVFTEKYYAFYRQLRECYPSAEIVFAYGIMNWGNLVNVIGECVEQVRERANSEDKDENVCCLKLHTVSAAEEIGVNGHPSVLGHERAAEDLYEFLREFV